MRIAIICLASALALTVGCSKKPASSAASGVPAATPAQANSSGGVITMPHRKSGLWEVAMTTAGAAAMQMTSQMCVDSSADSDLGLRGPHSQMKNCSKMEMHPGLDGVTFDSICSAGGRTATSHGSVKGDFNSSYNVDISTHLDPAPPGITGDMKMSMQARWIGPCPADLKPGQTRMNLGGVHVGG